MARRAGQWLPVCAFDELEIARGVTALVHGQAVAIFRLDDEQVVALSNHDPFDRTATIARGIVGRRDGIAFVASPVHKHAFDLRTGQCLEDPLVAISVYAARVEAGVVQIGGRVSAAA